MGCLFADAARVHLSALPWTSAFDSNMKGNVCSLSSPHIFSCLISANQNFSKLPTATRQRHFPHDLKATGRWSHFKMQRALIYTFCCTTWVMVFEWAQYFISVPGDSWERIGAVTFNPDCSSINIILTVKGDVSIFTHFPTSLSKWVRHQFEGSGVVAPFTSRGRKGSCYLASLADRNGISIANNSY